MNTKSNVKLLLDTVKQEAKLKTDMALAEYLGVSRHKISDLRAGRVPVGPAIILHVMNAHPISLVRIQKILKEGVS